MSMLSADDLFSYLELLNKRVQNQEGGGVGLPVSEVIEGWRAIGFQVGNSRFLVGLDETYEIFPLPEHLASIPNSQKWVLGIISLRGDLVPILDLKHFMHDEFTQPSNHSRVIMMNNSFCNAGLLVDEVYGLQYLDLMPEMIPTTELSYIEGSVFYKEKHWNIISFNHLANDARFMDAAA